MPYYVYTLLCEDCSYYTGYTKDVERRLNGTKASRLWIYRIHEAEKIACVEFDSPSEATKREREIKSLRYSKKQRMMNLRDRWRAKGFLKALLSASTSSTPPIIPVLSNTSLKNYSFVVVASKPYSGDAPFFAGSFDFWSLRSDFSSFC